MYEVNFPETRMCVTVDITEGKQSAERHSNSKRPERERGHGHTALGDILSNPIGRKVESPKEREGKKVI